jgi:hypothetical protein
MRNVQRLSQCSSLTLFAGFQQDFFDIPDRMVFTKRRKKMKVTFTSTKQSLQQAGGRMSIWHRCGSPPGNAGEKL